MEVPGTGTEATLSGLLNGEPARVRVRARNAAGWGDFAVSAEATPCTGPSQPLALVATTGPGVGQVTLQWEPPAWEGGCPVTGYQVTVNGGTPVSATSPHVATGLDPCVVHEFEVRAVASGTGSAARVTGIAPGTPPPPTSVGALPGDEMLRACWLPAEQGEHCAPLTRYLVELLNTAVPPTVLDDFEPGADERCTDFTGLTNGVPRQDGPRSRMLLREPGRGRSGRALMK